MKEMKEMKVSKTLEALRTIMGRPVSVTLLYDTESEFVVQSVEGLQIPQPQGEPAAEEPAQEPSPPPDEVPALIEPDRVKSE